MFSNTTVVNLGSAYDEWRYEIRSLLDEWNDRSLWSSAVPTVSVASVAARVDQLRYICLMSRLQHDSTRLVCRSTRATQEPGGELIDILESALRAGQQEPLLIDQPEQPPEQKELPEDLTVEEVETTNQWPHVARTAGGRRRVIVDAYGIYVRSLRSWLQQQSRGRSVETPIQELYEHLTLNPAADGPAVLVCPERIALQRHFISHAARPERLRSLDLQRIPNRVLLKLTVLHEIGHHVYQVANTSSDNLSEAMANWFAYGFLPAEERLLLHHKAATQKLPYRLYEGFLSLSDPTAFGMPWAAILPWSSSAGEALVGPVLRFNL